MRRSALYRIVSIMLSLAFIFSFSGCGNTKEAVDSTSSITSAKNQETATQPPSETEAETTAAPVQTSEPAQEATTVATTESTAEAATEAAAEQTAVSEQKTDEADETSKEASSESFVKGINFNGTAVTIEGNKWLSYEAALADGLSTTKKVQLAKTSCTIDPKADMNVDAMLNSGIWFRGNWGLKQKVDNGEYQVYLWIMENYEDNTRNFNIKVEGVEVAKDAGKMKKGQWKRYGPYDASIGDEELNIDFVYVKMDPHVMGMEIYKK